MCLSHQQAGRTEMHCHAHGSCPGTSCSYPPMQIQYEGAYSSVQAIASARQPSSEMVWKLCHQPSKGIPILPAHWYVTVPPYNNKGNGLVVFAGPMVTTPIMRTIVAPKGKAIRTRKFFVMTQSWMKNLSFSDPYPETNCNIRVASPSSAS